MTKIDYKPIFQYLDKMRMEMTQVIKAYIKADIKAEFDGKFDRIFSILDSVYKEVKNRNGETQVMGHRVTRLETWAGKVSKKVQIPTNF